MQETCPLWSLIFQALRHKLQFWAVPSLENVCDWCHFILMQFRKANKNNKLAPGRVHKLVSWCGMNKCYVSIRKCQPSMAEGQRWKRIVTRFNLRMVFKWDKTSFMNHCQMRRGIRSWLAAPYLQSCTTLVRELGAMQRLGFESQLQCCCWTR